MPFAVAQDRHAPHSREQTSHTLAVGGGGLVYGAPLRSISGSGCDSLAGELQTAPNIGADSVATGSGTFRIKTS